jgi:TRAP-type mannitol/chloroaromatic compound transport system permease small subunit
MEMTDLIGTAFFALVVLVIVVAIAWRPITEGWRHFMEWKRK